MNEMDNSFSVKLELLSHYYPEVLLTVDIKTHSTIHEWRAHYPSNDILTL